MFLRGKAVKMQVKGTYPKRYATFTNIQDTVNLGNFGQFNIMINKDGVIYDANNTTTNNPPEDTVSILTQLAQLNKKEKTAFDSIKNPALLLKTAGNLNLQFDKFLEGKPDKMADLLFRQGRGSILSLMEALAVCAGKLQDKKTQSTIMNQLKELIKKEPFRRLRDFVCESAVTRMSKHELPKNNELKELIYPSYPPECQKLNVRRYIDDKGTKICSHTKFLKSFGLNHKKTKDGDHLFTSNFVNTKPVHIFVPNPYSESAPSIYEHVGDKSIGLIDSWGHAEYGSKIDKALSQGKEATGDGQVAAHYECVSASNIWQIKNRYPGLQLITTTEATTDDLDEVCSKWLMIGLTKGWKWKEISRYVIEDLQEKFGNRDGFEAFNLKKHYIFPHMRLQAKYIDRDNDGIKDLDDHLFNVTYPVKGDLSFGFSPVKQDIPDYALNGENFNKAVDNLKLIVLYNSFLGNKGQVPWEPGKIECNGFFTPEKNETNTFRFHIENNTKKLRISLSKDFSHTPKDALSIILSYEAGCFLGKESGLSEKGSVILGLAMLDRAIHQDGSSNNYSRLKFIRPIIEEALFLEKYGLGGISFNDINKWLGIKGENDGTKDSFKRLIKNCTPVLKIGENLKSVVNINKIPITEKITIPLDNITSAILEKEVLAKLGIKGNISTNEKIGEHNSFVTVYAIVKDESETVSNILLGFDAEGNLHAAGRLNLDVNQARDKVT